MFLLFYTEQKNKHLLETVLKDRIKKYTFMLKKNTSIVL